MNFSFFPRIAYTGIIKNKKIYFPYFITCVCVISMFYIMCYIAYDEEVNNIPGGSSLQMVTVLGIFVIALFSLLFLIYTNSFLTKRRLKEFGLYNVLGMNKKNISVVLFFETLFIGGVSLIVGIGCGILFSKLAQLCLIKLIKGATDFEFNVCISGVIYTFILFVPIFVLIYFISVIKIAKSNTINLVKSEEVGEKIPKANWVIGIVGLLLLCFAYYLASIVDSAVGALIVFFVAVLLVIISTYMLLISGSVVLCKILQKNKEYYYKAKHFISTSTMAFRMKKNAAGLATICILSTMVLVMISSTACLYFGADNAINSRYYNDYIVEVSMNEVNQISEDNLSKVGKVISSSLDENGIEATKKISYLSLPLTGKIDGNNIIVNQANTSLAIENLELLMVNAMPLSDYNKLTGKHVRLKSGEAMAYSYNAKFNEDSIRINDNLASYNLIWMDDEFNYGFDASMGVVNTICIIIPNFDTYAMAMLNYWNSVEHYEGLVEISYLYCFDVKGITDDEQISFRNVLSNNLVNSNVDRKIIRLTSKADKKGVAYGTYGALFFLAVVLSIIFIFATVLIIYYKQISEGYEDKPRFEIMTKVGMSLKEIKTVVNSQMLTVFFLPLGMAILHLGFAFKMIKFLLRAFQLYEARPLIITTIVCIIVYSIVYTIIYKITSNEYLNIVSTKDER